MAACHVPSRFSTGGCRATVPIRPGCDGQPGLADLVRRRTAQLQEWLRWSEVYFRLLTLRAGSSGWHAAEHAGDEFVGLTRALLRAGASGTISALWNVDRDSSGALLRGFYRSWP